MRVVEQLINQVIFSSSRLSLTEMRVRITGTGSRKKKEILGAAIRDALVAAGVGSAVKSVEVEGDRGGGDLTYDTFIDFNDRISGRRLATKVKRLAKLPPKWELFHLAHVNAGGYRMVLRLIEYSKNQ